VSLSVARQIQSLPGNAAVQRSFGLWQNARVGEGEILMIIGAHIMLQSRNEGADKAFLADVLGLSSVDAGGGFLIFGLPPAEVAVHEADKNDVHQLFFMCDDIERFAAEMKKRGVGFTPPRNQGWGTMTEIILPGGGKLGVYQPHHARPKHTTSKAAKKIATKKVAKAKSGKKPPKAKAKKRR
jgi:hypothetical protein